MIVVKITALRCRYAVETGLKQPMSSLTKALILLALGILISIVSVWLIGGKKQNFDKTISIKARPYQLFPYLIDSDLRKKWNPGLVKQSSISDPDEISEGYQFLSRWKTDDSEFDSRDQVLRYQQDAIVSIRSKTPDTTTTSFYKLTGKGNDTMLEYRRVVRFQGLKRLLSVFKNDTLSEEIEEEIQRLISVVENEVDNSLSHPDEELTTVGIESNGDQPELIDDSSLDSSDSKSAKPTDDESGALDASPTVGNSGETVNDDDLSE